MERGGGFGSGLFAEIWVECFEDFEAGFFGIDAEILQDLRGDVIVLKMARPAGVAW